ncbi:MBL fold metallo-hydrolase [Nocardia sp. R6R-6]|uniref:MBL fold metallo-hydrolase n=1 Tax=Nocardia sp. R6R-6 TaxID=3459303 RepID=UPI00403D7B27
MDKPIEVADRVYAYPQDDGSWWVNTTGFVVGRRDIVAIDSCSTLRRTERFRDAIAGVADLPVTRLVNTHHHGDHTYGNALFDAVVIGHENCRTEALDDRAREHADALWSPAPDWGDLPLDPPSVTFSDSLTLYLDELRMELIHPGTPAHTKGDIVCWLPEQRVLFTGDLVFNGGTPLMLQGSVTGSLEALKFLRGFPAETLVPGHGIPTGPDILDLHERYYRFVLRSAEQARARGLTPLEAARELDLGEFTDLLDPERIVLNLHRAYADLSGDGDVDPREAFADAIAYNGGRPLRCVA